MLIHYTYSFFLKRPVPNIKWIGPKGEINSLNPDYQISVSGNILAIPVTSPRLSGTYRCQANNEAGSRVSEGQLFVQGLSENFQAISNVIGIRHMFSQKKGIKS